MPASIASSGPLTSPAPSLSPPPELAPKDGGMESDGSELSELTDDEDVPAPNTNNTRPPPPPPPPEDAHNDDGDVDEEDGDVNPDAELDEEDEDEEDGDVVRPPPPQQHSRRGVIPDAMWDWAYKKNGKTNGSSASGTGSVHAPVHTNDEPEEEEEPARPPTTNPLEEEEEEEEEDGPEEEEDGSNDGADEDDEADDVSEPLSDQEEEAGPADGDGEDAIMRDLTPPKREKTSPSPDDLTEEEGVEEEEEDDPDADADGPDPESEDGDGDDPDSEDNADDGEGDDAGLTAPIPSTTKEVDVAEALSALANQAVQQQQQQQQETHGPTSPIAPIPLPPLPITTAGSSIMGRRLKTPTPSPSPSPEPENENENDENDGPSRADPDADADADMIDPDADADEGEAELQPADRAEALDVLAGIELKFALVREKIYVEKMEDLAWEEQMLMDDCHPEMQHLQDELEMRRERRLEIASRKRALDIDHIAQKFENGGRLVWTWWMESRDNLQMEMMGEANRKRRKVERDRRSYERSIPFRGIPGPPNPRDVPPVLPTVRETLDAAVSRHHPTAAARLHKKNIRFLNGARRGTQPNAQPQPPPQSDRLYFPTVAPLAPVEVAEDLQQLFPRVHHHHHPQQQQNGHQYHHHHRQQQQPPPQLAPVGPHGHPHMQHDLYGPVDGPGPMVAAPNGVVIVDGPGAVYPPPPVASGSGRSRSSRHQHQQAQPPLPPPPNAYPGEPYAIVNGNGGPGPIMRRSPSPPWGGPGGLPPAGQRMPNGNSGTNGWRDDGHGHGGHGSSRRIEGNAAQRERDAMLEEEAAQMRMIQRDRQRRDFERERDREHELREREYRLQAAQQQQQAQQHSHRSRSAHQNNSQSGHVAGQQQQQQQQQQSAPGGSVPHHHHVVHHHPHHHHHHPSSSGAAPPPPPPPQQQQSLPGPSNSNAGSRMSSPRRMMPEHERQQQGFPPSEYDNRPPQQRPSNANAGQLHPSSSSALMRDKRLASPPLYYEPEYRERERHGHGSIGLGDAIAAGSSAHYISNPPPPLQVQERQLQERSRHGPGSSVGHNNTVNNGPPPPHMIPRSPAQPGMSTFPPSGPASNASSPRHHPGRDSREGMYMDEHRDPHRSAHSRRSPGMGVPGGQLPPMSPQDQQRRHSASGASHPGQTASRQSQNQHPNANVSMGVSPPGRQQPVGTPPLSTFPGPGPLGSPSGSRLQTLPPTSGGPPPPQIGGHASHGSHSGGASPLPLPSAGLGRTISPLAERERERERGMHPHSHPHPHSPRSRPHSLSSSSNSRPPNQQQQQQRDLRDQRPLSPGPSLGPLSTMGPPPPGPAHPSSVSMFNSPPHHHGADGSPRMAPHSSGKAQMVDGP